MPETTSDAPQTLVLDTNVVLDWLVFDDPTCRDLSRAISARRVRWIATQAMRDELAHVLARGTLDAWRPDRARVDHAWESHAVIVAAPAPVRDGPMRCADPDDQKFIDLALHERAAALLTSDRAVLRLARRARERGVEFMTAAAWTRRLPPPRG